MPIKVRTILDEIVRRELKGNWEFRDGDGFIRYINEKCTISGNFNYQEPDSNVESVRLSSKKESDNNDLSSAIKKVLALKYSLEVDEIYGTFEVVSYTDEEFSRGFSRLEQAERDYAKIIEFSANMLIRNALQAD